MRQSGSKPGHIGGKVIYGLKRDYPKIDIFVNGNYVATTTWSRTCKEAKIRYERSHPEAVRVTVRRQK